MGTLHQLKPMQTASPDPNCATRTPTSDEPKRKWLNSEEMEQLIKASRFGRNAERDSLMIMMGFRHGLRVSELINLRWDQINLRDGTIEIHRLKHGKMSIQYLQPDEKRALKKWRDAHPDEVLLFKSLLGQKLNRGSFYAVMREAGKRAGFKFKVHPHQLRHSCGYVLGNETNGGHGANTRVIQDFLGHRNIAHTAVYTDVNPNKFKTIWD